MPKTPIFSLPLCAWTGFSNPTQAALDALFAQGADHPIHALILRPKSTINSSEPSETGFLFDADGEPVISSAFKAPREILEKGAAAAFMVSHDPALERLFAAMSIAVNNTRHDRFAITAAGCLSWRALGYFATRGKEVDYQRALEAGETMTAYVKGHGARSAHERMCDHAGLTPVASAVYRAEVLRFSARKITGMHRRVAFTTGVNLRNGATA